MVSIETKYCSSFYRKTDIEGISAEVEKAVSKLAEGKGAGSGFLGWVDLPASVTGQELLKINEAAGKLRHQSDYIVVIGIGGSYLGARAIIEALSGPFPQQDDEKKTTVIFAGNNLDEDYHSRLLNLIKEKDFSVIVISKSGTTTEPAIAFRVIRKLLEEKYGKERSRERIVAITDESKGALKRLSGKNGYTTFDIPDNVGGRFSVLTPAGLLPVACAGFNIEMLIEGAKDMKERVTSEKKTEDNPALLYAALRNIFYRSGKNIEILTGYISSLGFFIEWWKQLFGESEGKDGKGIFPAGAVFTTDLHSLGQLIQEGKRNIFETVLSARESKSDLKIPFDEDDGDGLNYIAGRKIHEINLTAEEGTSSAHNEGNVPVIRIVIPEINEYYLGQLIYFFEYSCAVSGYVLGVNPFDQPGVEAYKKNMFRLLGKNS